MKLESSFLNKWLLLGLVAIVLGMAPSVHAQNQTPGLSMEAEAAFDGTFKYGEWLPLWVQVENSGTDLEAEVQVHIRKGDINARYVAPASLPSGARKRIPLYVLPNNFSRELEVTLVSDGEVLAAQNIPIRPQPNITYMVGLLTSERGTLSLITSVDLPGQERPKFLVDISLADLPEHPEGLRSFDVLIFNDVDTSSLSPEQGNTLEQWVRQGGRLVIGGGANARSIAAGIPATLLPIKPQSDVSLENIAELADFSGGDPIRVPGPFILSTGELSEGRTLVSEGEIPLIHERTFGAGSVDFVALDLTSSPFDAWAGTLSFWEKILSPGSTYPNWLPPDMSPRQQKSLNIYYTLTNLPMLDLPSTRELAILLGVYIVLVGPVNYFVLRRRRQLQWAWVSIPLITVIFSAGAFGLGYARRGTNVFLNKVALVNLHSSGSAKVESYMGLFSPAQQSFEVEVRGNGLLSPVSSYYDPWGEFRGTPLSGSIDFVQGTPGQVRGLAVSQGSMQGFMIETEWNEFGKLAADLQIEKNALTGTIQNQTSHTLEDVVVLLGREFIRVGDLSPGEKSSIEMTLPDTPEQPFGPPLSYRLFEERFMQAGPRGGPPRDAEVKRSLVENLMEQGGASFRGARIFQTSGENEAGSSIILLGWLDNAPPELHISDQLIAQQTTALLYTVLPYHFPDSGTISIPPGLISGTISDITGDAGMCGDAMSNSIYIGRGEATYEFQLPHTAEDLQIHALNLSVWSEGGFWRFPETQIYDWGRGSWSTLPAMDRGVNVLSNPGPFIGDEGTVRFRLSSDGNTGGCLYLSLGLEGEKF